MEYVQIPLTPYRKLSPKEVLDICPAADLNKEYWENDIPTLRESWERFVIGQRRDWAEWERSQRGY